MDEPQYSRERVKRGLLALPDRVWRGAHLYPRQRRPIGSRSITAAQKGVREFVLHQRQVLYWAKKNAQQGRAERVETPEGVGVWIAEPAMRQRRGLPTNAIRVWVEGKF